jgi:hypothetical protein
MNKMPYFAHPAEIARRRRDRAAGRAHHGLGAEADHAFRTGMQDRRFQFVQQHLGVLVLGLAVFAAAVFVAGRHPRHVHQERREGLAAPFVAAHRQRAQGVAVIALAARDEQRAFQLARLDEILARELQCRLHRLGAARHQVDPPDAGRRARHQAVGQLFRHLGGEEGRVRIGAAVDLAVHGGDDVRVAMAERGHRRAAAGIEIGLALAVAQGDAFAADGQGRGLAQAAVQDVAHGASPKVVD